MSSQPSHFDSSSPVHRLASRSHSRFIFPPDCQSAIVVFTVAASDSGREVFSRLTVLSFRRARRALRHGSQQLVKGVGKQLHTVVRQFVGHFFHRNARARQISHCFFRGWDIFGQTV